MSNDQVTAMIVEATKCPLCATNAGRSTLRSGDGYLYDCIVCGGLFEVGTGAQAHIDRGELHPDVALAVRALLGVGKRPRVFWDVPTDRFDVQPV